MEVSKELALQNKVAIGFKEILNSGTFVFLVGPEEHKFTVHKAAVSKVSDVLDKMMNGGMKEAIDGVARLPDTDPEIFASFIEFCYTSDYTIRPAGNETALSCLHLRFRVFTCNDIVSITEQYFSFSVNDDDDDGEHNNKNNDEEDELRFEKDPNSDDADVMFCVSCESNYKVNEIEALFPYCSMDCAGGNTEPETSLCVICGGSRTPGLDVVCKVCITRALGKYHNIQELANRLSLISYNRILANFYDSDTLDTYQTAKADITTNGKYAQHAELYVFAEKYNVRDLSVLSLVMLCIQLSRVRVSAKNVHVYVPFLEYVEANTQPSDSTVDAVSDPLRAVTLAFMFEHGHVILKDAQGSKFLVEHPRFALDFAKMAVLSKGHRRRLPPR